jgi:hypothetical protein
MSPDDLYYYRRWLQDTGLVSDTLPDYPALTTYPLCDYLCYIRDWLWQPCCVPTTYTFTVQVVDSNGIYNTVECSINLLCI